MTKTDRERFEGFAPGTVAWFEGLARDNSKAYFEANRDTFETGIKAPMAALLAEASGTFGGSVKLFRINRDIRFSKDKSPYKTSFFGLLHERPGRYAGLYAAISAKGLYAGAGYYDIASDQVDRFRAAAAAGDTGADLASIALGLEADGYEIFGRGVKTAPRGYSKDHPRIHLIRMKEIVTGRLMPAGPALATRAAFDHAVSVWERAMPLVDWLDRHVGPSDPPPKARFGRDR